MTTASCGDYSLLTPPPTDCHRVRAGPVTALLYDDYDSMPLHHRGPASGPYNLTCYTPTDVRHQHQQQRMSTSSSSSSSYQFSHTPVIDRSQPSTYHDTRQLGSTTAAGSTADHGHYASQRCDPSGYQTADGPYSYATPIGAGRCLSGIGGLPRPMSGSDVALQPDVLSPAYSPYGSGRCLQAAPVSPSSSLLMRTMGGCCVSGYCSPTGPCRCAADRLYEHSGHDPVTVNGTGHITGEHVSCRLQHHQQQQHPHQSAGTYKWMMIKRGTPKTTSGLSSVYNQFLYCGLAVLETFYATVPLVAGSTHTRSPVQLTLSKLLTYCVLRPTQPPILSATGNR